MAVDAADEALLRRAYDAFNARDVDAVVALMHPDVDWPNAFEGGRVRGHDEVRAYWARQFAQIDPRVTPRAFAERPDGRVAVDVHQVVRSPDGAVLSDGAVVHVYALRDGLVERMDVEPAGLALSPPSRPPRPPRTACAAPSCRTCRPRSSAPRR